MHFPRDYEAGYDQEYFRGLISEKLVLHRRGGKAIMAWEKTYERNEPLDCRNYARAAFKYFRWPFDKIEGRLKGEEEVPIVTRKQVEQRKRRHIVSKGIQV